MAIVDNVPWHVTLRRPCLYRCTMWPPRRLGMLVFAALVCADAQGGHHGETPEPERTPIVYRYIVDCVRYRLPL